MEEESNGRSIKFMFILLILILIIVIVWLIGFFYANDLSIKSRSVEDISSNYKRVLLVFPHADDEALSVGGTIFQLSKSGAEVYWLILTQGERGNENATLDESLKSIRTKEAENTSEIYGIKKLFQKEFPDNNTEQSRSEVHEEIKKVLEEVKPDLVITYDLAGLYGHPDHIVVSEYTTSLIEEDYPETKLWYVSFPEKILNLTPLPEHMAKDPNYKDKRVYPTQKVWVGFSGISTKIKAIYAYKSQKESFINSFPVKFIPLWFYVSMTPYEYIHETN